MINLDQILKLQEQVTLGAHFLYEALANCLDHYDHPCDTIKAAQNYFSRLEESATATHLFGLSALCQQMSQNLPQLKTLEPVNRKMLSAEIERIPRLLTIYLYQLTTINSPGRSKNSSSPIPQLVKILSSERWHESVGFDLITKIRENLQQDIINQHLTQITNDAHPQVMSVPVLTASKSSSQPKAFAERYEPLSKQIIEQSETLLVALKQFVTFDIENEAHLEGIEQYTNTIQSFWEIANKLDLKGFQEVLTIINNNVFECSLLSFQERALLEQQFALWPQLALEYLQAPESKANQLIEFLNLSNWPVPIQAETSKQLLTQLLQDYQVSQVLKSIDTSKPTSQPKQIQEIAQIPPSLSQNEPHSKEKQLTVDNSESIDQNGQNDIPISEVLKPKPPKPQNDSELPSQNIESTNELLPTITQSNRQVPYSLQNSPDSSSQDIDMSKPLSPIKTDEQIEATHLEQNAPELPNTEPEITTHPPSIPNQANVSLHSSEVMDLLIVQLQEAIEKNNQSLNELILADENSEALLMAIMTYIENVQEIADAIEQAGLTDLAQIGAFFNDNVMMLGEQPKSIREAARDILSAWPEIIITYLQKPNEMAEMLVSYMQNELWPIPLDSTSSLYFHFMPQAQPPLLDKTDSNDTLPVTDKEDETAVTHFEPTVLSPENPVATANIVLASSDVIELLVGQVQESSEQLATTLNQLITAPEGSESLLTAVESLTLTVQEVADAAEMANLEGLLEVCTFINDNIMVLASSPPATREAAQEVLLAWPDYVSAYLLEPNQGVNALVNYLQNPNWPAPLLEENQDELLQHLTTGETATKPESIPVPADISLADPEILELVSNQIIDSTEGLSAALEVCVSMENETATFLEAIEEYTNKVQEIWEVAEMANLTGLQEICTFVNDNLMAFTQQDQATKLASQPYFLGWPTKVLEYLQAPTTGAHVLVNFLQDSGWPTPLPTDAAEQLLIGLTTPVKAAEEPEPNQAEEPQTTIVTETTTEVAQITGLDDLTPLVVEISGEISLGSSDILEILTGELEYAKEDLAKELGAFLTLTPEEAGFVQAVENYTEHVQRLYVAAEMLGLEGLQAVCTFVIENMTALSQADKAARTTAQQAFSVWPDLVLAYLQTPNTSILQLVNHLRVPAWAQPLTDEVAQTLVNQLIAGSTTTEEEAEEEAYNRQTEAQPEDVFLTIPEDINQELLEAYLQETPQHAQDFSALIQNIIQNPEIADIERAQRIAHTLKGSSNILGIKGIANIAHHLEDTLEYLAKHQVVPPAELTNTMVEAADCIEIMVDALLGQDEPPPQAQQVLQSVLDWANRIDKGKLDAPPPAKTTAPKAESATVASDKPASDKPAEADKKAPTKSTTEVAPEQVLRVPTKTVDELMRLVGELSISVGQIQEKLKHVIHSTRTLTEQDLVLHRKTFELENLVDVRGITGIENRSQGTTQDSEAEDFDPLEFEEYNELHSVAHSFTESIADNRELAILIREDLGELETMFIHQERLNKEFQASIMTTRMVPVNTILSKLQRNVRQTCRMTSKKAELELVGTDILIDSDVLNNLGDPLQHILRNAIDHGIENAEERVLLGKPESGHIKLSFYREGNNIVVKCEDDGQGLNYTNIRFTAIQRGLITENQELSESELARLILMSGFSTKSGVTQVSGRGVGMDVVHTNIRQMKGTLDLTSKTGVGTTMLIKLPMTLVTVHVLLVRAGEQQFGIPTSNLEQALAPGLGELYKVGEEITLKLGKNIYALKSLASLLQVADDSANLEAHETRPIILVHEETGITAVVVDELLDTHDLVMKNMGKYVKNLHGVSGAAILGDGSLVPLLDLPELLRSPMQATLKSMMAQPQSDDQAVAQTAPQIMIVDDSLSVRKSLSLLVEDAGFETLLAKDGVEAIEVMNQTRPQVMLVDMEMPRMNGLELTAHVRANPATQQMPIFMITSRTTEKHREQAKTAGVSAYLTKPYQDTELLDLIDKALAR